MAMVISIPSAGRKHAHHTHRNRKIAAAACPGILLPVLAMGVTSVPSSAKMCSSTLLPRHRKGFVNTLRAWLETRYILRDTTAYIPLVMENIDWFFTS